MRFLDLEEFGSKSSLRALLATLFDALRTENPHASQRRRNLPSVCDLERRAVSGPRAAVIVDASGGDIGVAEPFRHLGDGALAAAVARSACAPIENPSCPE
jgi:hypothetical protein